MKSSDDDLPTPIPRTRVTRSLVARDLSPTTTIPPVTPPPRRHVSRINANVTPQHGGTPAPGLATNYYDPIYDDTLDDNPPEGVLPTSSQNSPSLLTPLSPGDVHNLDDPPPLATLSPSDDCSVSGGLRDSACGAYCISGRFSRPYRLRDRGIGLFYHQVASIGPATRQSIDNHT